MGNNMLSSRDKIQWISVEIVNDSTITFPRGILSARRILEYSLTDPIFQLANMFMLRERSRDIKSDEVTTFKSTLLAGWKEHRIEQYFYQNRYQFFMQWCNAQRESVLSEYNFSEVGRQDGTESHCSRFVSSFGLNNIAHSRTLHAANFPKLQTSNGWQS